MSCPPIGALPRICIDRQEMREAPAISLHAHGLMDPAYRAWDRPGITDEHYSNYRTSVLVIFGEQSLRAETRSALLAFLAGPSRQLPMEQFGIDHSFYVRHRNVADGNHRRDYLARRRWE